MRITMRRMRHLLVLLLLLCPIGPVERAIADDPSPATDDIPDPRPGSDPAATDLITPEAPQQDTPIDALTALRHAVALAPENAEAHLALGLALYAAGSEHEAVAEWRETIRLDPHHAHAAYRLGVALLHQTADQREDDVPMSADPPDAVEALRRSLR